MHPSMCLYALLAVSFLSGCFTIGCRGETRSVSQAQGVGRPPNTMMQTSDAPQLTSQEKAKLLFTAYERWDRLHPYVLFDHCLSVSSKESLLLPLQLLGEDGLPLPIGLPQKEGAQVSLGFHENRLQFLRIKLDLSEGQYGGLGATKSKERKPMTTPDELNPLSTLRGEESRAVEILVCILSALVQLDQTGPYAPGTLHDQRISVPDNTQDFITAHTSDMRVLTTRAGQVQFAFELSGGPLRLYAMQRPIGRNSKVTGKPLMHRFTVALRPEDLPVLGAALSIPQDGEWVEICHSLTEL